MVKDYFQDILQPDAGKSGSSFGGGGNENQSKGEAQAGGERSIRNITVNPRAPRTRAMSGDVREASSGATQVPYGKPRLDGKKRVWIWVIAAVSVVVLGVLALFAFRSTTITVTPRSRPIVFNQSVHFIAYPSTSAATGTLSYTVIANDIEDSAVVASSGTEHAEDRASGTIVVFNEYSPSSVRLIKNTRFATPAGLIFRVPATVVIPGKKGSVPGSVTVTVVADQAGEQYNIGPVDKFTLPGLKTSPDMYSRVYARSTLAFTGGFVGDRPGVAKGALDSAKAEVRGRMESKSHESARSLASAAATVFPDLIRITYESLPPTTEAGGGVRIHEKARVEIPVLSADAFAQIAAHGVGENTDGASFKIVGLEKLVAGQGSTNTAQTLGTGPIDFTLTGNAVLVWNVDSASLSQALAGRDQSAFEGIINGFPSIQEARARIEPFWKGTFPASQSDITIEFVPVQAAQ
ncbi:MAG: hypothetical protein Q7S08_01345 [bacterium]|nr:hypothetical protein [bacterium]